MEYQHVTGGRNVNVLLEDGISTCYWRAECQRVTRWNINMLLEGGMSTCYWRMEYQHVTGVFAEYNQQDATFLHLFISVRRSACFRRGFRPSSEAQNCTYNVRYLSHQHCYLLLAWTGWNWFTYAYKSVPSRPG